MVNSLNMIDIRSVSSNFSILGQVKDLIRSINHDIEEACTQTDLHVTLYYFSKAKSSCLVLGEILSANEVSSSERIGPYLIRNNNEMVSMLNSYIHLNRVNIIMDIRRKKK